jgi:MSHA biogenesis protein MshP
MNIKTDIRKQRGISLIVVVFLLAGVSVLALSMMNLSGTQQISSMYTIRSTQAYFAARSGMEYAIDRVTAAACGGITSPQTISGFTVTITCTPSGPFDEGNPALPYTIYRLTTTATGGTLQVPEPVNRQITVTFKNP